MIFDTVLVVLNGILQRSTVQRIGTNVRKDTVFAVDVSDNTLVSYRIYISVLVAEVISGHLDILGFNTFVVDDNVVRDQGCFRDGCTIYFQRPISHFDLTRGIIFKGVVIPVVFRLCIDPESENLKSVIGGF